MAENQNVADQASTLNDERATRLAKRAALFEAGQNPYPEHSEIEDYVADIEAKYAELADGEDTEDVVKIGDELEVKVAEIDSQGRINLVRNDIEYDNAEIPRRSAPGQRPPRRDANRR